MAKQVLKKFAGLNLILAGAQGRGKTKFKEDFLANFQHRENWDFDPNEEFKYKNKAKFIYDREEFLKKVPAKKGSRKNVGFSDATGFFSKTGVMPKQLHYHVCRKRHSENINIFDYHGITQFNLDNLIYFDFIVLFRTEESEIKVRKVFEDKPYIIAAWLEVQEVTRGTFFDTVNKIYSEDETRPKGYSKAINPISKVPNYHHHLVIRTTGR